MDAKISMQFSAQSSPPTGTPLYIWLMGGRSGELRNGAVSHWTPTWIFPLTGGGLLEISSGMESHGRGHRMSEANANWSQEGMPWGAVRRDGD